MSTSRWFIIKLQYDILHLLIVLFYLIWLKGLRVSVWEMSRNENVGMNMMIWDFAERSWLEWMCICCFSLCFGSTLQITFQIHQTQTAGGHCFLYAHTDARLRSTTHLGQIDSACLWKQPSESELEGKMFVTHWLVLTVIEYDCLVTTQTSKTTAKGRNRLGKAPIWLVYSHFHYMLQPMTVFLIF